MVYQLQKLIIKSNSVAKIPTNLDFKFILNAMEELRVGLD
jgi:hypothetical protein